MQFLPGGSLAGSNAFDTGAVPIIQQIEDPLGPQAPRETRPRVTLETVYRFLRRERLLIGAIWLLVVALAVVYLFNTTPLYRATAGFTAEPAGAGQGDAPVDYAHGGNFLYAQSERLSSRAILALALANPDVKYLKTFLHVPNRLNALRRGLSVDVGKKDDIISVSFDSPYADDSPHIVNAVVEAYRQYQTQPKHQNTADVLTLYQEQIDGVQKQLDETTAKMRTMEGRYGVLSSNNDASSLTLHRLTALSQELTSAQFETLKAKTDLDAARKSLPHHSGSSSNQPAAAPLIVSADQEASLRSEMIQLQSQLQEMRQRYLPDHPALQSLQRQIEQVDATYAASIERRWMLARERQDDLQKAFDEQQKQTIEMGAKSADYARLNGDADRYHKSIDNIVSRMQAIQTTRESGSVEVDFLDPAQGSVRSHPQPLATLSLAVVMGLLLGVAGAFGREWMDDRLRSPDDARVVLGLRLLGSIPQMPSVISPTVAAQKITLDPSSDVADAYRAVRGALQASAPRERSRTIAVTSASAGDGKTTSASNLAIALAQSGKKVLLVDADFRDPMLHTIFGSRQHNGLSSVLSGQTAAIEKGIQATSVSGLWVLSSGPAPRSSTELLNTPALPELLDQLADKYDHVLIDTPPVIGQPDARIIAACCDLTILVLRCDASTRRRCLLARDSLNGVGAHVLGIIVTRAPRGNEDFFEPRHGTRGRSGHPFEDDASEEDVMDIGASPV